MRQASIIACLVIMVASLYAQRINGFHLNTEQQAPSSSQLDQLAKTNARWVSISPVALANSMIPRIEFNTEWQPQMVTAVGIAKSLSTLKQQEFNVMLKPMLQMEDGSLVSNIEMLSPRDWEIWWGDYTKFILHYAHIADSLEVELLCVGSGMTSTEKKLSSQWKVMIDSVRTIYDGKITYGASWRSYADVSFWNKLDYLGIQGYFPCDTAKIPRVQEMVKCLEQRSTEIQSVSFKYDIPVLFTEFGYRSIFYAAKDPQLLPSVFTNFFVAKSQLSQVNAFSAFFKVLWTKDFVAGGFIWRWHPNYEAFLTKGNDYSPQGKGAEEVITEWYKVE